MTVKKTATKIKTPRAPKPAFDFSKSIVAVTKGWGDEYDSTFFKDQAHLLSEINYGNFSVGEKTKFFSLAGTEVKVTVSVEKVPVMTEKKVAKIAA